MHTPAIEFKGGSFTLSILKLVGQTVDQLEQQLKQHVQKAPKLFSQMPVILDLSGLQPPLMPLEQILTTVRGNDLKPMALIDACEGYQQQAQENALPCLRPNRRANIQHSPLKVIDRPVRSGQQIYAQGGDLVVLAPVSNGAELVADGSIHVYGAMRGRAFAGATGNTDARIFCHDLQAELVAIAGHYHLSEHQDPTHWQKPTMIQLEHGRILHSALPCPQ
ncbi:septum site-determining protein MinC [Ferrimonas pelagia]|uniref:Probable septum site-determining protein MinC n=1 Tax=Ferrimonas pelagia TaxID=1177826 RepID=A0ABP9FJB5_9GAMM